MISFWQQPLDLFFKKSKSLEKLQACDLKKIQDLLNIKPLSIYNVPPVRSFHFISSERFFKGHAQVINVQSKPNYWARGRGKILLYNIIVNIKDLYSDEYLTLKWFNSYPTLLKRIITGVKIEFIGQPQINGNTYQLTNPEYCLIDNPLSVTSTENYNLKINYPTINSVPGKFIKSLIDKIPSNEWDFIPEILPLSTIESNNLLPRYHCYKIIHGIVQQDASEYAKANYRLTFEELYLEQVKLWIRKDHRIKNNLNCLPIPLNMQIDQYEKLFPYSLTQDQKNALNDILIDLKSSNQMMRLIQGDVGCGKTAVAFIASFIICQAGGQVAIMCPTETLARQHYFEIKEITNKTNLNISLLIGSTKANERKIILNDLTSGKINIILGTHSLFQKDVIFQKLSLAIIDEQHKFGVDQRLKLLNKGTNVHGLLLSATPIPRSLSLTKYGDMDLSLIKEMPTTRRGYKTKIITKDTLLKYLSFVKTRIEMGEQIYIVTPVILNNPENELANLENTFNEYTKYFPDINIAKLHGQLSSDEKIRIMEDFKNNKIQILVTTSVIEVGVNVINATIMTIYGPERFGLSSLHQLRGRIGRGLKPGFCFLIYDSNSNTTLDRLKIIENTSDGFVIAEEDLRIRGEGEILGINQSGNKKYKFAELPQDQFILETVINDLLVNLKNNKQEIQNICTLLEDTENIKLTF